MQCSRTLNNQNKVNDKLPEPVGPIRRMLLFSSSTSSSSMVSAFSLPESVLDLTPQVVLSMLNQTVIIISIMNKKNYKHKTWPSYRVLTPWSNRLSTPKSPKGIVRFDNLLIVWWRVCYKPWPMARGVQRNHLVTVTIPFGDQPAQVVSAFHCLNLCCA